MLISTYGTLRWQGQMKGVNALNRAILISTVDEREITHIEIRVNALSRADPIST